MTLIPFLSLFPGVHSAGAVPRVPINAVPNTPREAVQAEMATIVKWAEANQRDAKWDRVAYWSLKAPALLASASGAILHLLQFPLLSAGVDAVAAFCIALDAMTQPGQLYDAHRRAANDLFLLQDWAASEINQIETLRQDEVSRRERYEVVFNHLKARKTRINASLTRDEANLGGPAKAKKAD